MGIEHPVWLQYTHQVLFKKKPVRILTGREFVLQVV